MATAAIITSGPHRMGAGELSATMQMYTPSSGSSADRWKRRRLASSALAAHPVARTAATVPSSSGCDGLGQSVDSNPWTPEVNEPVRSANDPPATTTVSPTAATIETTAAASRATLERATSSTAADAGIAGVTTSIQSVRSKMAPAAAPSVTNPIATIRMRARLRATTPSRPVSVTASKKPERSDGATPPGAVGGGSWRRSVLMPTTAIG